MVIRTRRAILIVLACVALVAVTGGCAAAPRANPSFAVTVADANRDLSRMKADRRPLSRPLVIVTGFMDPGFAAAGLGGRFRSLFDDRRIVTVTLGDCGDLDRCRDKVIAVVDRAFPTDDPAWTAEVDVVGYSLGGLVARDAALPRDGPATVGRSLRVARLFTISTPHRGADEATRMPLLHAIQRSLRAGSPDLQRINAAAPPFPVYPYVVLGDRAIGEANTAPPGRTAWWVENRPLADAHNGAYDDPRILADIARRLRDEPPLATEPAAPLPAE